MKLLQILGAAVPNAWKPAIQVERILLRRAGYRAAERLARRGAAPVYRCPCCGTAAAFRAGSFTRHPELFDQKRYQNTPQAVFCPVCRSLPRHRILALWCERHRELLRDSDILYFAQEYCMRLWMRENGISCVTADLKRPADRKMDLQQTGLPDECFDVVFCNHVLEHVEDYRKALREIRRILRPGGRLICSFPIDPKIDELEEDTSPMPREERVRRFGQCDHNRVFGCGADRLLADAGFAVERITGEACPVDILPVVGPADYDVNVLFCCRKPPDAKAEPLVSVIVPVYNVLPYLGQCVTSILDQSYPRLELILVDDGSTDGSGELCDNWGKRDSRVRVIHQENRGLSGARNTGLDQACGEYVCFVDSDDYVHRDMLRTLMSKARAEDADIVLCGFFGLLASGHIRRNTGLKPRVCSGVEALEGLFRWEIPPAAWGKLYRRSLWETLRFPVGRVYEDIATIYLALYHSKKCVVCADRLIYYRMCRPESITSLRSWKNEQDLILAQREILAFVAGHLPGLMPAAARWLEAERMGNYLRMAQPDSGCPPEELARLRSFVLKHAEDLSPDQRKDAFLLHCAMLPLIRHNPKLAVLLYRCRRRIRRVL